MRKNNFKKAALTLFCSMITVLSFSQTTKKNINIEKVYFKNNEIKMAANLFFPENMDKTKKYSAIICVHPSGAVKEQSSGLYAQKLARKGFITIAYDASYQGESGGEPRLMEDPNARVEDIRAVIDYLSTLPYVDISKIGVFGICAGGGYALAASQTERRIKAFAAVNITDGGSVTRNGWMGDNPVQEQTKMLEAIAAQRTAEANGAPIMYMPYFPDKVNDNTPLTLREAFEYYKTPRGQHPNAVGKVMFSRLDKLFAFSASRFIGTLLTQPALFIAGTKAESNRFSKQYYEKATCDKELFFIEGASHIDLYDKPQYVDQAIDKLSDFYNKKL